ncbi:uncharacterized protein LOC107463953 [Arachis duranensis]|uniref:Uncharacterized protein LOC107463953 n=1 Tax=Arachis duranensis TaxID=130453 RepID=A0A9C6TFV1_ARADU|nr:uncharacterized protein LOC107463953 [Arachis duranensis]
MSRVCGSAILQIVYLFCCCHSRLPASIFSVGVVIPILPSPPCDLSFCPFSRFLSAWCWCHSEILIFNPVFFIPIQFVFLDPFLDYPSFLHLGTLCIKMFDFHRRFLSRTTPQNSIGKNSCTSSKA